jgi:hypothetical protein
MKREENGGLLIPKDRTKPSTHKRLGNKNFANKGAGGARRVHIRGRRRK